MADKSNTSTIYEKLHAEYGDVMKPNSVAEVLQCHPSHVRAMCQNGDLPAAQFGRRWFILTEKFAAKLEGDAYVG